MNIRLLAPLATAAVLSGVVAYFATESWLAGLGSASCVLFIGVLGWSLWTLRRLVKAVRRRLQQLLRSTREAESLARDAQLQVKQLTDQQTAMAKGQLGIAQALTQQAETAKRDESARAGELVARQTELGELANVVRAVDSSIRSQSDSNRANTERIEARLRQLRNEVHGLRPVRSGVKPIGVADSSTVPGEEVVTSLQPVCKRESVNLVLATFDSSSIFAGVRTAVVAAVHTARILRRPLRLVILQEPRDFNHSTTRAELQRWVAEEAGAPDIAASVSVTTRSHADVDGCHPYDVWIATYWTTAVALQRASNSRILDPTRVLYLVQDWEPGFMAWGTEHALASATYSAGFELIVNSTSLAHYLEARTGIALPPDRVFRPAVDVGRLHAAAKLWRPGDPDRPRLLFYARPSKPRNLYTLGLDALRLCGERLPHGIRPIVALAGEDVQPVDLGARMDVERLGKLDLDRYYEQLSTTDLGLALMLSPHPSHLPLELPMAGIPTVTNELDDVRRSWVAGLHVAAASPESLATALLECMPAATAQRVHTPQPEPEGMGVDLVVAVTSAVSALVNGSGASKTLA